MAGNKEFEERLKRLGHDAQSPAPRPVQRSRSSSVDVNTIALMALALVALVGAAVFYAQWQNRPLPMQALASAYLADDRPPPLEGPAGIFGVNQNENIYQRSCIPFLPAAPQGWVRVHAWDTKYPQLIPRLEAIWQDAGQTLGDAPGINMLSAFIERYSGPNANKPNAKFQRSLSSALYLNVVEGKFLQLNMRNRSWREASNCHEEFLYQWQNFDPENPPRYPVLNQFSSVRTSANPYGVPPAMRAKGFKNLRAIVPVSTGLEISVQGIANMYDIRNVLNGDDISAKVAQALAAPAS